MKIFARNLLVILFFTSIYTFNLAQTENKPVKKNNQSFSFYFINGYALAYDYYKTEVLRLRVNLDLDLSGSSRNIEGKSQNNSIDGHIYTSGSTYNNEDKNDYLGLILSTHLITNIYQTEYGNIYLGIGPGVGYSSSNGSGNSDYEEHYLADTTSEHYSSTYVTDSKNTSYSITLTALFAVEALVTENISLFAEAHLMGGREWTDIESNSYSHSQNSSAYISKGKSTQSRTSWLYNFQYARIGVRLSI